MVSRKNAQPPKIGAQWACEGGIYAGVVKGGKDTPDQHVVVYGVLETSQAWHVAKQWAESVGVGHQYRLATKQEHCVIRGNLADQVRPAIYWTGNEHPTEGVYAFVTNFDSGSQNCALKRTPEACALAVRTIPVRA